MLVIILVEPVELAAVELVVLSLLPLQRLLVRMALAEEGVALAALLLDREGEAVMVL